MLNNRRPLRVAVLCSQRAPGLLHLLNRSPERGVAYEIVCAVTSQPTFAEELLVERRGIPVRPHPIAPSSSRADYDAETVALVAPFLPDLILLDGYRYLVTASILDTFPNRVVNLHLSDLTLRKANGAPRYPGIRAVRDAITAGSRETRACVHLANAEPDAGAVIVRSWPFPVSPLVADLITAAPDVLKSYVFAHERWMIHTASGPLIAAALHLIAGGDVDLDGLGSMDPSTSAPWALERQGFLTPPQLEVA